MNTADAYRFVCSSLASDIIEPIITIYRTYVHDVLTAEDIANALYTLDNPLQNEYEKKLNLYNSLNYHDVLLFKHVQAIENQIFQENCAMFDYSEMITHNIADKKQRLIALQNIHYQLTNARDSGLPVVFGTMHCTTARQVCRLILGLLKKVDCFDDIVNKEECLRYIGKIYENAQIPDSSL